MPIWKAVRCLPWSWFVVALTADSPIVLLPLTHGGHLAPAKLEQMMRRANALARRRSLSFAWNGGSSHREMVTVGSLDLDELSLEFARLYEAVRTTLETTIKQPVFGVPDANERYVVNVLDRPFDEQGWHLDDYAYAVNLMLEAPREGGTLQVALGDRSVTLEVPEGTWYALRTDNVPHRVTPLLQGRRVVFNCAYHTAAEAALASYSSDRLYARRQAAV